MAPIRHSYDLLMQSWIPVTGSAATPRQFELMDLLRDAASPRAAAGVPPARVAAAHGGRPVVRRLDAPSRELLVRLTERRATAVEPARGQRLCAGAARTAINGMTCRCARSSPENRLHTRFGIRATVRLARSAASTAQAPR